MFHDYGCWNRLDGSRRPEEYLASKDKGRSGSLSGLGCCEIVV